MKVVFIHLFNNVDYKKNREDIIPEAEMQSTSNTQMIIKEIRNYFENFPKQPESRSGSLVQKSSHHLSGIKLLNRRLYII